MGSPYTDPRSFVSLSFAIEGVGAAAYQGAAKYIDDKDTLGVAAVRWANRLRGDVVCVDTLCDSPSSPSRNVKSHGSRLQSSSSSPGTGPSRHRSHLRGPTPSHVRILRLWVGICAQTDTPSRPAAQFITSCPSANPTLPVTPLPALNVSNASPAPGSTLQLTFDAPDGAYLVWLNGLEAVYTPVDGNKQTTVPEGLHGTVYVGVVSSEQMPLTDASMVTGLAIVQMPLSSMDDEVNNA